MVTRGWGAPGSRGRVWSTYVTSPVGQREANHCPGWQVLFLVPVVTGGVAGGLIHGAEGIQALLVSRG